jgi:L,D-peptidoglycan transpeptidase YkuD (ErfK/YbiS/YcfS/YnhG family)
MPAVRLFALAVAVVAPAPAFGASCPAPLGKALRLIMVTAPSMDSARARLQLFTRTSTHAPWKPASKGEPAVVGKAGLAWGYPFLRFKREGEPEKFEGDKRTPAGAFRVGSSFGFAGSKLKGHILVKANETVCVEDPASPLYNTITRRAEIGQTKADNMRDTPLYRHGLFVDYPSHRRSRRGSCILIHIWRGPDKGTSGCIALPEARVRAMQAFAQPGAVLAVLPETARERFAGCLP